MNSALNLIANALILYVLIIYHLAKCILYVMCLPLCQCEYIYICNIGKKLIRAYVYCHICPTGAWGMDFVSSSPLFSTTPPFFQNFHINHSFFKIFEKLWTQNTRIIHDV